MTERPLHPEDLDLARQALRGESRAREEFARRTECVAGFLSARNARAGSPLTRDELRDVIQDTLTAIWRKLPVYAGRSTLESWAYQFCMLGFLGALRRRQRRPHLLDDQSVPVSEPESRDAPLPGGEFDDVYEGLARLTDAKSEVIRLKHFDEMTFEEIADRLGLSANTVKTRYYRGLAQLRELLGTPRGEEAS